MRKYLILLCPFLLIQCHPLKKRNMRHKFEFYTFYNQFYIENKGGNADTSSDSFWTEKSFKDGLAIGEGIIGVGTKSYGYIKGDIEVLAKSRDNVNFDLYDHIVEGGINIDSGTLEIRNCPDASLELSLKIKPGKYRIRIYGSNYDSVLEPDLAKNTDKDYYKIEIWPDNNMECKILKQYIRN